MAPSLRGVGLNLGRSRDSKERHLIIEKLANFMEMNPKQPSESRAWSPSVVKFDDGDWYDANDGNDGISTPTLG
jgi:hypothetical protein